jgi:hypothetical protein
LIDEVVNHLAPVLLGDSSRIYRTRGRRFSPSGERCSSSPAVRGVPSLRPGAGAEREGDYRASHRRGLGLVPRLDSPGLGLGLPILVKVADEVSLRSRERGGTEVAMRFSL